MTGQVSGGIISSVTMIHSEAWQFDASVTLTQYSPPAFTWMDGVVSPVDQRKVTVPVPPITVGEISTVSSSHMMKSFARLTSIAQPKTFTWPEAVAVQPLVSVIVTV